MAVKHVFVSGIADGADTTVVRPSNWNDDHTVEDNTFVAAKLSATDDTILFGRATAGAGAGEEIIIGTNLSLTGTTLNAASGSSTWDTIGAAAGDGSTLNGDWNMVYQVAKVTNSENCWSFIESAAATNGTSTTGVPNQVLLRVGTIAASTMSPLSVYTRAVHVFSVSPTTTQVLYAAGTAAAPIIATTGATTTGISWPGGNLTFSFGGTTIFNISAASLTMSGSAVIYARPGVGTSPSITDATSGDSGLFFGASILGISTNFIENSRFIAGAFQNTKSTADAVAYAINVRKSRGTVASPTVITTGDDLGTLNFAGYVGATNTYRNVTSLRADSVGTISDATNGIGGEFYIGTQKQGVDTSPIDRLKMDQVGHVLSIAGTANTPTVTAGGGGSPTITGTDTNFTLNVGTGGIATTITVTFGSAYPVAPRCTANHQGAILVLRCVSTTTTVVIDAATAFTASGLIDVIVSGGTA